MRKVVASNIINSKTLHWLLNKWTEEADNLVRFVCNQFTSLWSLLNHIYAFAVSDYIPCLRALDLDGHEKIVSEAMRIVSSYEEPIIDERGEQWSDGKKKEAEDLLDTFILAKNSNGELALSVEEIKAQITAILHFLLSHSFSRTKQKASNKPETGRQEKLGILITAIVTSTRITARTQRLA
ncbi:phenylalanine N-monooxygenase-like [Corylus avellana]|uniref:phenylalanine N-monooxygenase-like n=1 Tax=Corylus avellana TaxID=13451 RepID=UPI001E20CA0A|nr:phenylalanine N-monooxygenase-like [Corylus avellana]